MILYLQVQIWDTAGLEKYQAITQSYYNRADAIILVYDITRAETFDHIPKWLNGVKENAKKDVDIILIGNMSDRKNVIKVETGTGKKQARAHKKKVETCMVNEEVQEEVETDAGAKYARDNNMSFLETSARTGRNIDLLFQLIAKRHVEKQPDTPQSVERASAQANIFLLTESDLPRKRRCCFRH